MTPGPRSGEIRAVALGDPGPYKYGQVPALPRRQQNERRSPPSSPASESV